MRCSSRSESTSFEVSLRGSLSSRRSVAYLSTTGFNKEGTSDEDRFATLQSMLLYQLLGLFHRDEQRKLMIYLRLGARPDLSLTSTERILSHTFHGALVSMLRQLELPRKIKERQLARPHQLMQGAELDTAWKAWIEVETWRR